VCVCVCVRVCVCERERRRVREKAHMQKVPAMQHISIVEVVMDMTVCVYERESVCVLV